MSSQQKKERAATGGRPRKFSEPSRPVTVTLPERTLSLLASVDSDRARAIVKVTDAARSSAVDGGDRVRLAEVGNGVALIVVGPSAHLRAIPWLKLVEISPASFILALPSGVPIEKLEVAIADIIEKMPDVADGERLLLDDLRKHLTRLRRENKMRKSEIIFVDV